MSNPVVDVVVLVVFVFVGVTILSLLTVAACCVCWILSDFKMRSTFELTSDWKSFDGKHSIIHGGFRHD